MPVKKPTFHQRARTEQLVDLAIEVIGERGLVGTSVSAVARRAGVSRGVVAYNVGDLDQLLALVVARVYELGRDAVRPAVDAATDPRSALLAFVSSSLDFYVARPAEMHALNEIFTGRQSVRREATTEHRHEVDDVGVILRAGQADGSFVACDPALVTRVLRTALDFGAGAVARGADVEAVRTELLGLVERVVGDPGPSG